MRPSWFRLLELNNERRRFGLTVPFLVGALLETSARALESDSVKRSLTSLLRSMRDETPQSHVIRISECDRLHQPVAAPIPGMITSGIGIAIPPPNGAFARLYIEQQYLAGAQTVEAASQEIWLRIGDALAKGYFSFRDGSYHPFDDDDHDLIRRAAASEAEDDV